MSEFGLLFIDRSEYGNRNDLLISDLNMFGSDARIDCNLTYADRLNAPRPVARPARACAQIRGELTSSRA